MNGSEEGLGIYGLQMRGDLVAEVGYWDKKPAIILKAKRPREANRLTRYIIIMEQIWIYSEDHYEKLHPGMPETYESFMLHKCFDLYELFDLGLPDSRKMAQVAWLIQDSIDQLLKVPPYKQRKKVLGEAELTIDGQKITTEVKG
jgi:hypothetical protein